MVHNHYVLKHSRVAIVFQITLAFIMSFLLFQTLNLWIWMICNVLLIFILVKFNQRPQPEFLYQLDHSEWSLQFKGQAQTHRVNITHFVDHHFYISVYFSDQKIKNCIIWMDQLDIQAWKSLKVRAKLD